MTEAPMPSRLLPTQPGIPRTLSRPSAAQRERPEGFLVTALSPYVRDPRTHDWRNERGENRSEGHRDTRQRALRFALVEHHRRALTVRGGSDREPTRDWVGNPNAREEPGSCGARISVGLPGADPAALEDEPGAPLDDADPVRQRGR